MQIEVVTHAQFVEVLILNEIPQGHAYVEVAAIIFPGVATSVRVVREVSI